MPQKPNKAGQMQNYVPAGNGDASGEYGDNATEEDYKKFVEYIYSYIGADLNDFNKESGEENDMEEQKIRKLLKQYGAEDVEIENFMTDLKDMKDEAEEENLLIANADKLKATQEGREIIKNAPTMAKDELAKKIKEFLQ